MSKLLSMEDRKFLHAAKVLYEAPAESCSVSAGAYNSLAGENNLLLETNQRLSARCKRLEARERGATTALVGAAITAVAGWVGVAILLAAVVSR